MNHFNNISGLSSSFLLAATSAPASTSIRNDPTNTYTNSIPESTLVSPITTPIYDITKAIKVDLIIDLMDCSSSVYSLLRVTAIKATAQYAPCLYKKSSRLFSIRTSYSWQTLGVPSSANPTILTDPNTRMSNNTFIYSPVK